MPDNWNPIARVPTPLVDTFGQAAYKERRLPDEVLASFETSELPADAVVTNVLIVPYRGERPVLAWRDGRLTLPGGDVLPGEPVEDAIKRVLEQQVGILQPEARHLGHFRCRATVHSQKQPAGTITYRGYYVAQVGELADAPSDPECERRIVLQRDLNNVLRTEFAEYQREYMDTLDRYVLELRKQSAGS